MSGFREVLGLPVGQCNAAYEQREGIVMRVGIPHRGGHLAFHAFQNEFPAMVSANAFWDRRTQAFRFPQATDLEEVDFALDSAGFTAMRLWKAKGTQSGMAGVFPWSFGQYVEFATGCGARWWAAPDLCCEPEIASSPQEVDYRIRATATLLEGVLRTLYAWQNQLARTCNARTVANMLRPPVPVIQGWAAGDYQRSLDLLLEVWRRWEPWLAPPALIGVGSVCRRPVHHAQHGLLAVLAALEGRLPRESRLHLFGVKGACLRHLRTLDWVGSADSMAYDDGARRKAWQARRSNTVQHRAGEMARWMTGATNQLRAAQGDQRRLPFF